MRRFKPVPDFAFRTQQEEYLFQMCLARGADTISETCRITKSEALAWITGETPVPYTAYVVMMWKYQGIIIGGGFDGWRVFESRLYHPKIKHSVHVRELELIWHYRSADRLVEKLDRDLIAMKKKAKFYQEQCTLEARHGWILRQAFGLSLQ